MRVGYLGPEGTFSEQALLENTDAATIEPVPLPTIHAAVMAVHDDLVACALVPIENSIEGAVTAVLDALAGEARDVRIGGEVVLAVHQALIARDRVALAEIDTVVSHPQASGQCAHFLRTELPRAEIVAASSTADAVRIVAQSPERGWAALGTPLAAEIHGCQVLRERVEDEEGNETRFVWLAREGATVPALALAAAVNGWKTSLVFWGLGADGAGWLVACLDEFAQRDINLTRIESRPRRRGLGSYMFFVDLEGRDSDEHVAAAIEGLRGRCEELRVLGSYPAA